MKIERVVGCRQSTYRNMQTGMYAFVYLHVHVFAVCRLYSRLSSGHVEFKGLDTCPSEVMTQIR